MKSGRLALISAMALFLLIPFLAAAQAAGGTSAPGNANAFTGTIVLIKGMTFEINLADGTHKTILLKDNALILDREVVTADQIKAGDAVGVAATSDNGALTATSINIFAPEMWSSGGMRKGQFPMATGELMTNAMTAQVETNTQGHVLTLKLDMGDATIAVPDGIQIHRLIAVKPDQLKLGMKVTFRAMADADGNLTASGASFDQPTRG